MARVAEQATAAAGIGADGRAQAGNGCVYVLLHPTTGRAHEVRGNPHQSILLVFAGARQSLPARVVYRMEGDPVWHVPERVGGDVNLWGDEQRAGAAGRGLVLDGIPLRSRSPDAACLVEDDSDDMRN